MALDTSTSLANFFKTKFRHELGSDLAKAGKLAMDIDREARTIEVGGTSLNTTWTNISAEGVGSGALSDGGDYPTPLAQTPLQYSLGLAHLAFAVGFTGHTEAMGSDEDASWIGGVAKYLSKRLKEYAKITWARFLINDGTPNWGLTTSAAVGTTNGYFSVDFPVEFVRKGEVLTVRDAATSGTETISNGTVVDIDHINSRIYCSNVTGVGSGEYVSLSGFYNSTVPNGIQKIVGNTGSIQGQTRTTVGNFMTKAIVLTSTGLPVTATSVDELRDTVETQAAVRSEYRTKWYAPQSYRRWAMIASQGLVRFTGTSDIQLGAASVNVADSDGYKEINEDPYIDSGTIYAIAPKKLVKAYPKGMKGGYPIMNGSSVLFRSNAGSGAGHADSQRMYWVMRCNLGSDEFRCHGKDTGRVSP
ncbi:MAG: hypothetical protein ACE5FA_02315 [Dehalococcoidia bacterium]